MHNSNRKIKARKYSKYSSIFESIIFKFEPKTRTRLESKLDLVKLEIFKFQTQKFWAFKFKVRLTSKIGWNTWPFWFFELFGAFSCFRLYNRLDSKKLEKNWNSKLKIFQFQVWCWNLNSTRYYLAVSMSGVSILNKV